MYYLFKFYTIISNIYQINMLNYKKTQIKNKINYYNNELLNIDKELDKITSKIIVKPIKNK